MKAAHLRIGNTVLDSIGYFDLDANDFSDKKVMRSIRPIYLSDEWMERFDFTLTCEKWYHNTEDWIMIDMSCNSVRLWTTWLDRKIKYVHELQNLYFALTGKELEVND